MDLTVEVWPEGPDLELNFEYSTELFDETTIARMAGDFQTVLAAIVDDRDIPVADLFAELSPVGVDDLAGGPVSEIPATTVLDLLHTGGGVAVSLDDTELSYVELRVAAARLAAMLRRAGVGPGAVVGLHLPRVPELLVAMLAVWQAGAAYLPLDPAYPAARLTFMLEDSGARLVLSHTSVAGRLATGLPLVLVDADRGELAEELDARPAPEDPAYVIYTSGSTGRPKGVVVEHRALASRVRWMREEYALTPADQVLQFASPSFDTHAEEIFPCLAAGARLVLMPSSAELLTDFLRTPQGQALSVLDLPTPYWHELVSHVDTVAWPPGLRLLILGADQVRADALERWFAGHGDTVRVLNTYGPTETTVIATTAELRPGQGRPPIGRPLADTTVYVLDERLVPVPIGVAGELCIGGAGLARGYLNRPELTAERFLDTRFGRLYRTGDRGRMCADGSLEFLGRLDDQVKIRGYRVESGEIEAAITTFPGARRAAVVARDDRLIAYVVGDDVAGLRRHLAASLPEHMIPSVFVVIDTLPLTPNGKLDVRGLPAPGGSGSSTVAPRTPSEELVTSVWAEVLGLDRVGVDDDFFELGGHSLLAVRVIARLSGAVGVDVPLRSVFSHRTAGALAAAVDECLRGEIRALPAITPRTGSDRLPLSVGQERLWFLHQLDPDGAAYNIPATFVLRGELDVPTLERALNAVVARHESLRTRMSHEDGRPYQEVAGELRVPLARLTDRNELAWLSNRPFDLETGPLLRAGVLPLEERGHVVCLVLHHIVADGWSIGVLFGELMTVYEAFAAGTPSPLPPLAVQYPDFAVWQRKHRDAAVVDELLAHWRERLAGVPALELPTDRPRPPVKTSSGAFHTRRLPPSLAAEVVALARRERCTLFMTLLAAYQLVLGRYSRQDDFCVGSPIAGRDQVELEPLIGFFPNTLVLRADLSGDPSFRELLARTRVAAVDAYVHQDIPFERLLTELKIPRDPSRSPLFQTMFVLQNAAADGFAAKGFEISGFDPGFRQAKFDLTAEAWHTDDGLSLTFEYNTDLFDAETIERLGGHLENVLAAVVARPELRLSEVDMLSRPERGLLLEAWNATGAPFPEHETLHSLIEAQARRTPDAVAVVFEGSRLTYAELDERTAQLADRLRGKGVGPGSLIAVRAERSLELIVSLLGVLKSGAAYLPLDPDYPAERLAFMLADSGARPLDDPVATEPAVPGETAYVIYTSGSTGRPKGVPNSHRGIVNRLDWMQKAFPLTADDVVLQKTPAGFDVSVWELFWPLLAGAQLVLARPGGHKDAGYLRDLIIEHGVTTVHFVPSMLAVFLAEEGIEAIRSLRRTICSGEELPPDVARRFFQRLPGELHNLYGPTEAAIDVTAWQCTPNAATVPIGRPIQNIRLYVLDPAGKPTPVGIPGELHIGGAGVALGYLNRPELTAERFVPDPFGSGRLYRTGDLVRWRRDGVLEFLGRMDNQVKVRGLRIELGEIEAVLREQPGVVDAAVAVREDSAGDKRIVGYLVGAADVAAVRAALKQVLPDYMVPAALVPIEALPLSPNGKLDRSTLPAPEYGRAAGTEPAEPRTGAERLVAGIWRQVLGVETLGIDDDFFDLGGHSLLATQVIARLRRATNGFAEVNPVSVMGLFQHPTVGRLAELLDGPAGAPRGLLYELTNPVPSAERVASIVCVPYGGGSAVVYQPLADALPPGYVLHAVAIPGHDIGLTEASRPLTEVAQACATEILAAIEGPLVLYGHCVGSALTVEIARRLEAAGRVIDAVYLGGIFPFARPRGGIMGRLAALTGFEKHRSDRGYANWLTSMGADLSDLDPEETMFVVRTMRHDARGAEEYFTGLFQGGAEPLRAPIISVVGERDPMVEYYQERYREWGFLTGRTALVVLDEAGHYFLKFRADELAEIVTAIHPALATGDTKPLTVAARGEDPPWWLHVEAAPAAAPRPAPRPSLRRFLPVAAGQLVSITGSALTEFAIPIWIYLQTGSLVRFAVFAILALVPGLLLSPIAGAIVDRMSRRRVMLAGDCAAGLTQALLATLYFTGSLAVWHIYVLLVVLSGALTFQRLAWASSVPQLVPKPYLGHANGIVQLANGVAQFIVPLAAVGLLAGIGLGGLLIFDVGSYLVAIAVVLAVQFPATMAHRRRESLVTEIRHGFRYSMGQKSFRTMLIGFALFNIFLSPMYLMISPLVLSFATLDTVGRVAFVGGIGTALGGLAMTVWGGPGRRRMRGTLAAAALLSASCLVIGLRPALVVVMAGVFGMFFWLTVMNGIYTTIVQVKVPQRFHGRVFSLNTVLAWSTLPVGFGVVAPLAQQLFEPLMTSGGTLASSVGAVIGTGPGRGIALMYVLFSLAMLGLLALALRIRALSRFDDEVPDAPPDDLVGARARAVRRTTTTDVREPSWS
jgi:amino acid adenylation domain-containing protein